MDHRESAKRIWELYYNGTKESEEEILSILDPDCVVIGTGRHEIFRSAQEFMHSLSEAMAQESNVRFHMESFTCEEKELTPDVHMVFGSFLASWKSADSEISIDLDSRYTMVYRCIGGEWKIIHIHQSMPNREQLDGEYYPKTLSARVQESEHRAELLMELVKKDSLTGLVNLRALQEIYTDWHKEDSWMIVADLDDFKKVNDTGGHLYGNDVLKEIAGILRSSVRRDDVVARIGGDEFIILCGGIKAEPVKALLRRIVRTVAEKGREKNVWVGISMGAARVQPEDSVEDVIRRADRALYFTKNHGKNGYTFDGQN